VKAESFPFEQVNLSENVVKRTFAASVDSSELIWHLDREDRLVTVLEGSRWLLQLDNELPKMLEEGKSYFIPKMTYHRIIKGTGGLILEIKFK